MKTLYIIRHAKSSWDFPELSDFERPLNARGRRAAPLMGERLAQQQILPDLILSSPAVRAFTTAQIIAEAIGYPVTGIKTREELYMASASELLQQLQTVPQGVQSLMLFGHNPGLTSLSTALTRAQIDNVPTAGVVGASLPITDWTELRFGQGELLFFDYPKKSHS